MRRTWLFPVFVIGPRRWRAPLLYSLGRQPEVGHQLPGAAEARDVAELGQHRHRRHRVDPAEAAQQPHRLAVVVAGGTCGQFLLQGAQPLLHALDRAQVVVESGLRGRVFEAQRQQPAAVPQRPVPAVVGDAAPQQQLRQAVARPRAVGHGVLARPAEVAHHLLIDGRRMHRREQVRAQQLGELPVRRDGRS